MLVSKGSLRCSKVFEQLHAPTRYVQSDMACDWPSEWELETKKDMSGSLKFHQTPVSQQLDSTLRLADNTCEF